SLENVVSVLVDDEARLSDPLRFPIGINTTCFTDDSSNVQSDGRAYQPNYRSGGARSTNASGGRFKDSSGSLSSPIPVLTTNSPIFHANDAPDTPFTAATDDLHTNADANVSPTPFSVGISETATSTHSGTSPQEVYDEVEATSTCPSPIVHEGFEGVHQTDVSEQSPLGVEHDAHILVHIPGMNLSRVA
ncbi:hypothetical protein V6N11_068344, partial [Hibiscus sabdariffa]